MNNLTGTWEKTYRITVQSYVAWSFKIFPDIKGISAGVELQTRFLDFFFLPKTSTSFRPLKITLLVSIFFFFLLDSDYRFLFSGFILDWNMECTTLSSVVLWILLTKIFTQPLFSDRIQFFHLVPWKVPWNTTVIVSPKHTGNEAISWSPSPLTLPLHYVGRETEMSDTKNHYLALCFKMYPKKLVQLVD